MEGLDAHQRHRSRQEARPEDHYCGLDLYHQYVAFQRNYAETVLQTHRSLRFRRAFLSAFHIYPRKKFWCWFDSLAPEDRERMRKEWALGYEEVLRQEVAKLERGVREDLNPLFGEEMCGGDGERSG